MLLIDDRIGSKDLLHSLVRFGVPAELTHLEFADVAFVGKGVGGSPVLIGVELKETRDLIASLQSSRFVGHQLGGLQGMYDRSWLITEGIWRTSQEGVLETWTNKWVVAGSRQRPIMARDLDKWLLTVEIRGGMSMRHCATRRDTIQFLSCLYHWWTSKDLEEHRSHQAIYQPPPDRVMLREPSQYQRMVACLPGVGWTKSLAVERHFDSSYTRLLAATVEEWMAIPGIGRGIAQRIVSSLEN